MSKTTPNWSFALISAGVTFYAEGDRLCFSDPPVTTVYRVSSLGKFDVKIDYELYGVLMDKGTCSDVQTCLCP